MFIFGGKDKFRRRRQDKKDGDMQKDVTKKRKNDSCDEENDDLSMLEHRMQLYINADVQQCFDSFDVTGTGVINFEQVKMAFSSFYIDVDDDDCEEVISSFDTTGNGNITYDDFYREMRDVMAEGGNVVQQNKDYQVSLNAQYNEHGKIKVKAWEFKSIMISK